MTERIYYLDNLRALAMLLGVYLHAAFAYASPAQTVWLATDVKSSVMVDVSIWWIHLFRMSLFFWLSGYFGKLVIQRRGTWPFLKQRVLRLGLPMLVLYPFLLGAMGGVIVFSLNYQASPRGLMGLIAAAVADEQANGQSHPWTTMHLWFLYYLLMFTLLGTLVARLSVVNFDWIVRRPKLLILFPLTLIPGALMAGSPLPAPESFVPELWPFAFYGIYYWLGWQTYQREQWLRRFQDLLWPMLIGSVVLFAVYYCLMPDLNLDQLVDAAVPIDWPRWIALGVLSAYLSASLTLIALLLGQRFLDHHHGGLRLMADAAYWTYLVHLPLVLFMQTLLAPLQWPLLLKLILVLMTSMVFCVGTYVVFVRYTFVGWLLHGKREFP